MKKLYSLIAGIVLLCNTSNAQYVNLPDSFFQKYLLALYPACFNSQGQLDTTCSQVVNEDTLQLLDFGQITNIYGLRYFKHLTVLYYSSYNKMEHFDSDLPQSLKALYYFGSNIDSFTVLPNGLKYLYAGSCPSLKSLPLHLPDSLKYLDVSQDPMLSSIPSLPEGLEYLIFRNSENPATLPPLPKTLRYIDIFDGPHMPSQSLGVLPDSLRYLNCGSGWYMPIKELGDLPPFLDTLICSNTYITSLSKLPANLKMLDAAGCVRLKNFPVLPPSLLFLNCGADSLTTLPVLPEKLQVLRCADNFLTSLPALPASLTELDFSNSSGPDPNRMFANAIRTIPALPANLKVLGCNYNPLYTLPALPTTLISLYCDADSLSSLPALPKTLTVLHCANNKIQTFPVLDKPTEIYCQQNDIYCMPGNFSGNSTGRVVVKIGADKINCLPKKPANVQLDTYKADGTFYYANLPLCNPVNNVNHCDAFPVMSGTAFYDNNSNGIKDGSELPKQNIKVALADDNFTFTDENGYYEIGTTAAGNYTTTASGAPSYFNITPPSYSYNFTSYDTLVTNNFALQANAVKDSITLHIYGPWIARPGFPFYYFITCENSGTTTHPANLKLEYDNTRLNYESTFDAPSYETNNAIVNNGSNLTLNLGNFTPGQQKNIFVSFNVKTSAVLGDWLSAKAVVNAGSNEYADTTGALIKGSFDPNDKQATTQLSPAQVAAGKYINYVIRFQNTGTDTAFNIVIADTLSNQLQWNTLEMLNSSHPCKTTVKSDKVYFEFNNILLPDSNVNEPASHGFVAFRIKPTPTVPVNSTIYNKASIFFDYNLPVVTNTAGTLIQNFNTVPLHLISFNAVPQNNNTTALYWNTANEINTKLFVIEQSKDGIHFIPVGTVNAKGLQSNNYTSTVSDANAATIYYRIKITDNDGNYSYSPVVKIDQRKNSTGFSILINPVKDFIIINTNDRSLNNTSCNIISTEGVVVKTFTIKQGSQIVYVKDLPAGVYYVRTVNGSNNILIQ